MEIYILQGVSQMLPKVEDLPTSTFLDTCNVHGLLNAVQLFQTLSEKKRLSTTLRVADKIIFVLFCLFVCILFASCYATVNSHIPAPLGIILF